MSSLNNTWLSADDVEGLGRAVLAINETETFASLHANVFRATATMVSHDMTGMSVLDAQNRAADSLVSRPVYQYLTVDFATMLEDFFRFPGVGDGRYFGTDEPHAMLDYQDVEAFRRSLFYQGFYRPMELLYEVSMTTPGAHGAANTLISLGRKSMPFTDRERLLLKLLQPHLQQRMRALQVLEPGNPLYGQASIPPDPPLLFVNAAGHILGFERSVPAMFARLGLKLHARLPQAWREWLTQQIAAIGAGRPMRALAVKAPAGGLHVHLFHNREGDEHRLVLEPAQVAQDGLTRREAEVAHWLAQGKTNAEIARILDISAATAKNHVERILHKLKVESRLAAALIINRREGR